MQFQLTRASDWHFEKIVDINSIEDLRNLSKEFNNEALVVNFSKDARVGDSTDTAEIIVYDDYLE